jgi:hypothetical protein
MNDVGSSGGSMSGSLNAAADPASAKSPRWVLVDSRTIKVARGAPDDAAASDSSRRGSAADGAAADRHLIHDDDGEHGASANGWDDSSVA